jgi:chaperonin cofactor prefoldin
LLNEVQKQHEKIAALERQLAELAVVKSELERLAAQVRRVEHAGTFAAAD